MALLAVFLNAILCCAAQANEPEAQASSVTDEGRLAYATHCASCHGPDFGGGFGPALIGKTFREKWAGASAEALLTYIETQMPPAMPGTLAPEVYVAIHN